MSTQTWSSRIRHDSDATYQEWRDEMITKLGLLVTAGVLAADETNITPGAGARPGTNTEQGYAVFHLADSLHGTAPVYLRFGFGTNTTANGPRLQLTVGTSTNGSGVIGGTAKTAATHCANATAQATDTARNSYMCSVAGFFGLGWKIAGTDGFLAVCRTVDADGLPTATGAMVVVGSGGNVPNLTQALRFAATAAAYTANNTSVGCVLCLNVQRQSSSLVGSDTQAFVAWTITPAVAPLIGICGVFDAEMALASTFSVAMVGATPRTYLALAPNQGSMAQDTTGSMKPAILWE